MAFPWGRTSMAPSGVSSAGVWEGSADLVGRARKWSFGEGEGMFQKCLYWLEVGKPGTLQLRFLASRNMAEVN